MELNPLQYLRPPGADCPDASKTALIILNTPQSSPDLLRRLWSHAAYRICADGGANRLYDLLPSERSDYLPTSIHGDLDSLQPHVRAYYSDAGVPVTLDPDQYSTDFGKALSKAHDALPDITDVLILGSLSGRVDHGLGLLGELLREQRRRPNVRLWLFGETSVSFIVAKGEVRIGLPLAEGLVTENVGVLPIYGPARILMKGVEWEVEDWETEMGGMVSTSNHIRSDVVTIGTDRDVLFTVERAV